MTTNKNIRNKKAANKGIQISLMTVALALTVATIAPSLVLAVSNSFDADNDILFYQSDQTSRQKNNCDDKTTPPLSYWAPASVAIKKSDNTKKIFQLLISGGFNAGQAAAIMGNMYRESGFNSDAHEGGNDIGYGLAQWSKGRRTKLEKFFNEKGISAPEYSKYSDIDIQIEFLISEYHASYEKALVKTNFKTGSDIAKSTKAWMVIFESPFNDGSEDPAAINSVRIPAAQQIYKLYGDLDTKGGTSKDGCNNDDNDDESGGNNWWGEKPIIKPPKKDKCPTTGKETSGPVPLSGTNCPDQPDPKPKPDPKPDPKPKPKPPQQNKDAAEKIASMGIKLALTYPLDRSDGKNQKHDANKAYQEARTKYNPVGEWSDCGRFVATAVLASGVDPHYMKGGTGLQKQYLQDNPKKYAIIDYSSLRDAKRKLRRGDIIVYSNIIKGERHGHTLIYTGGKQYPIVEAALRTRVPSVEPVGNLNWIFDNNEGRYPIIARVIE